MRADEICKMFQLTIQECPEVSSKLPPLPETEVDVLKAVETPEIKPLETVDPGTRSSINWGRILTLCGIAGLAYLVFKKSPNFLPRYKRRQTRNPY